MWSRNIKIMCPAEPVTAVPPSAGTLTSSADLLEISVAPLLSQPGHCHQHKGTATVGDLGTSTAAVSGESCELDLTLEALTSGEIMVWGALRAKWTGECRRCLSPVSGQVDVKVKELFQRQPREGETYLLRDDKIHLGDMLREALLLSLPLAPLCSSDCLGPAPKSFAVSSAQGASAGQVGQTGETGEADQPKGDPRWAVLDELKFDGPD